MRARQEQENNLRPRKFSLKNLDPLKNAPSENAPLEKSKGKSPARNLDHLIKNSYCF